MAVVDANGHVMHYEVHGRGPPVLCAGGWGTWCHGNERHLPRGLTDAYEVVVFDHRGIGASDDDPAVPATTALYARDVAALLDHLGTGPVHFVGIAGIGACVGQVLALERPDLVRSLVNSGAWARADRYFVDQLALFLDLHRELGFEAFQRAVVLAAFDPDFYAANLHRLLGPSGGWSDLRGNLIAHERLTAAAAGHDVLDRLGRIAVPTLVLHAGRDGLTAPRLTLPIEHGIPGARGVMFADAAHVFTGRELKKGFCDALLGFLAEQG